MKYCEKYNRVCNGNKCDYFVSRRPMSDKEKMCVSAFYEIELDPYVYDWCNYYGEVTNG